MKTTAVATTIATIIANAIRTKKIGLIKSGLPWTLVNAPWWGEGLMAQGASQKSTVVHRRRLLGQSSSIFGH